MEIETVKNNLKQSIDEVFEIVQNLAEEQKNIKFKAYRPSEIEAKVFLDYFSWEDGNAKQNFEALYKKELQILQEWLQIYCLENDCAEEEALSRIIDGAI